MAMLLFSKTAQAQSYFTADVKGSGKPLILIHGLYCSGKVWEETVQHYQKDFECHILTLSGFGGNEPNLNDNFLEAVTNDLIAYIKSKNLAKPVVMGHSMGGFISFWAASKESNLFDRVIAVDGLPYFPILQMPAITKESAEEMATNMKTFMADQTPEQTKSNQKMYLPTMIHDAKRIEEVAEIASRCHSPTIAQVMYEMYTVDLRREVSKINCPVLLMGSWIGYKQYGVTHESALKGYTAQVASIKNSKVEISDTAKHFIFYDDPQWFFEKVDAFLK
jgi:pimeloyl-ACP methyl ester carboxylesterase